MAASDVLCPHCNRKQKVPEHRLTEIVVCLVCRQQIVDPWMHKVEPEKQIELAIKLKGRIVSEFGTTNLDELRSKADDYTGRFEPVDDDEEARDETGTGTGTARMLESGMYHAVAPRPPRVSTAAKTYIVAGVLLALLASGVVVLGVNMLSDKETTTSAIDVAGGAGERIERHSTGAVKARWQVVLIDGIAYEHGPWQEWHLNGEHKTRGSYHNGDRVGQWTGWHENGQKSFDVVYVDGKQHGQRLEWHPNGHKAVEGAYVHGERDGEWRAWHRDGRLAAFSRYDKGNPIGEWVTWHENGDRASHGLYVDGVKEGRWTYFHDNGVLKLEERWSKGHLHGESSGLHRNRARAFVGEWNSGMRVGVWTWWHTTGELERRGGYEDGNRAGIWREYHPSGVLKEQGPCQHGRRHGEWEVFDRDGELIARCEFSADVLRREQHFYRGAEVQYRSRRDAQGVLLGEWTVLAGAGGEVKHGRERAFHGNEKRAHEGTWLYGERHGLWRTWDADGNLTESTTYNEGRKVD